MFPIWDELGRVVGFSGRVLTADAPGGKYVNTPESPVFHKGKLLYALHMARQAFVQAGTALVCEGQLDVIACHRSGIRYAVAPQGTAFTEEQAKILRRHTAIVTFAFDADEAGQKAVVRSMDVALAAGLGVRVVSMPGGKDPDEIYRHGGSDAVSAAVSAAVDGFAYVLTRALSTVDGARPEGRAAAASAVLGLVARLEDPMQRAARCQWLAGELHLPEAAVFDALNQVQAARRRAGDRPRTPALRQEQDRAAPVAAPVSPADSAQARVEATLLDLALSFGVVAHELVQRLPADWVSDSPMGQALNHVLAMTREGEWAGAGDVLASDSAIVSDPDVARILVDSEFRSLLPDDADEYVRQRVEAQVMRAMGDCLAKLEEIRIGRRLEEIATRFRAGDVSGDALAALLEENHGLAQRRQQLMAAGAAVGTG
jgi:DNA primase